MNLLLMLGLAYGAYFLLSGSSGGSMSGKVGNVSWRVVPIEGFANSYRGEVALTGFGFVQVNQGQDPAALKLGVLEHIASGQVPGSEL